MSGGLAHCTHDVLSETGKNFGINLKGDCYLLAWQSSEVGPDYFRQLARIVSGETADCLWASLVTTALPWRIAGGPESSHWSRVSSRDVLKYHFNWCTGSSAGGPRRHKFAINVKERSADEAIAALRDEIARQERFWHLKAHGDLMFDTAEPNRTRHL